MKSQVLVLYSSKHGSTTEIAGRISQVLRESGFSTDTLATNEVHNLQDYKAVIIGSALYIGQWRKEAIKFLKGNEKVLAQQSVWLFSSGPTGKGDPVELLKGLRFPRSLQFIADRIKPKDIAVFHGNLDLSRMSFFEKWMIKNVKAPVGDFRDWNAIEEWAKSIAGVLKEMSGQ
jgi:menaquinone-dependent protoporphyrinogen oxidase